MCIRDRTYPARSVQESEDDRVLRGAHHGFVETLIFNTALIRRYIRSPQLTMDITPVSYTHLDVYKRQTLGHIFGYFLLLMGGREIFKGIKMKGKSSPSAEKSA